MKSATLQCCLGAVLAAAGLLATERTAPAQGAERPLSEVGRFFEAKVRPILVEHCIKCHGPGKQRGGLRLDSREAILTGGDRGSAIVAGQPDKSLLIRAVRHEGELKMPPPKKLTPHQVSDLVQWVKVGAPWPAGGSAAVAGLRRGEMQVTDKDRAHWAFRPVRPTMVPAVKNAAWCGNPVDAFLAASLEQKGIRPNLPATKHELIRRATYDLTGLPPSPGEVEAFLADSSTTAYESLIDRLLGSPQYGEKWSRHWLDLVRFAETNSYERDDPKPNAWRFRDYVIRSFNADKPYDRFLKEQLAGDELPDSDADALIATGYYRLGIWDDEPTDREQARYDGLDDIIATTGQVFLGLTFDCARCHDHKIDPVPQKDYYRLLSFFHNIHHFRNGGPTDEEPVFAGPADRADYERRVRDLEKRRREARAAASVLEAEFRQLAAEEAASDLAALAARIAREGPRVLGKEKADRYRQLRRELEALMKEQAPANRILCVTERGPHAPDTFVLARGNPHVPGDKVEPAFPVVLGGALPNLPPPRPGGQTTGRRLALANWIASPDNPLTARVMVNRVWQHHFGRGLVRSANNFGLQGDRPTHSELLDWLASEFIRQGWRLKPVHRLLMTSQTYRMSSRGDAAGLAADPANDLFWRFDPRRLAGEEVRDAILSVSGTLNLKMYGPGVYVDIPAEVLAGQSRPGYGWGKSPPEEQARRSVYIHVKRSLLTPILESFDAPDTDRSSPVRFATTQPTQALGMLNGAFLNQQAALFAARLRREAGDDPARQARRGLFLATARQPSDGEVHRGVALIESLRAQDGVADETALKYFCLVVLNLNELLYLD